jgi:hypothetical protein
LDLKLLIFPFSFAKSNAVMRTNTFDYSL